MFQSKHPYAEMHAAARAVSGGPVYVSDKPGVHDPQLLKRLVFPDGTILRTQSPARPTVDCLFKNVMEDGVTALKIWSRNHAGGGVVAAFNVQGASWSRRDRKYVQQLLVPPFVRAEIRPLDIGGGFISARVARNPAEEQSYIVWSSHKQTLSILSQSTQAVDVMLGQKGWEILTIAPVRTLQNVNTRKYRFSSGGTTEDAVAPRMGRAAVQKRVAAAMRLTMRGVRQLVTLPVRIPLGLARATFLRPRQPSVGGSDGKLDGYSAANSTIKEQRGDSTEGEVKQSNDYTGDHNKGGPAHQSSTHLVNFTSPSQYYNSTTQISPESMLGIREDNSTELVLGITEDNPSRMVNCDLPMRSNLS